MEELKLLIAEAQEENIEAYGKIIHRFHKMVFGCAFEILQDHHLAEDVVQQVFIQAISMSQGLTSA